MGNVEVCCCTSSGEKGRAGLTPRDRVPPRPVHATVPETAKPKPETKRASSASKSKVNTCALYPSPADKRNASIREDSRSRAEHGGKADPLAPWMFSQEPPDVPSIQEARLGFALAIAAYLGDDTLGAHAPSLFDPRTKEIVPKELQDQGLEAVLEQIFGFTLDHFINNKTTDAQGFIAHGADTVVLAYRGSMQLEQEWITKAQDVTRPWHPLKDDKNTREIQARAISIASSRVHIGHYQAFLSTKDDLEEALLPQILNAKFSGRRAKLIICGHSLGGSLASLAFAYVLEKAAADIAKGHIEVVYVSLGAPRIGNAAFVKHVAKLMAPLSGAGSVRLGRYVNNADLIPYSSSGLTFKHLGQALIMARSGEVYAYEEKPDETEDEFLNKHVGKMSFSERASDHKAGSYRDGLFWCEKQLQALVETKNRSKECDTKASVDRDDGTTTGTAVSDLCDTGGTAGCASPSNSSTRAR